MTIKWVRIILVLAFALPKTAIGRAMEGEENWSQWKKSMRIYINTTPAGADIKETTIGFPLLINLSAANFNFEEAQAAGKDIRFLNMTGSKALACAIKRWDKRNRTAEIWVKVDTIWGNTSSQYIEMLWGNQVAKSIASYESVFDSQNGFVGFRDLRLARNKKDASVLMQSRLSSGAFSINFWINIAPTDFRKLQPLLSISHTDTTIGNQLKIGYELESIKTNLHFGLVGDHRTKGRGILQCKRFVFTQENGPLSQLPWIQQICVFRLTENYVCKPGFRIASSLTAAWYSAKLFPSQIKAIFVLTR